MRRTISRAVAVVIVLASIVVGVHVVREATQSTHYRTSPDSRLRVVVEARTNRAELAHSLEEITLAHLSMCRLDVRSNIEGGLEALSSDPARYAVVLAPALDSTDRKQFRGCVEDWNVDHNLVRIVSMEEVDAS